MNYHVIELTTYADGTAPAKGIYGAYTELDAKATFHQKMSGAMKNANYATELLMVITEAGNIVMNEYFVRANEEEATNE